jgi:hypothetical protein
MANNSAMKSYLENNLHYFAFSSNSERPIKGAISHFSPDTPVEDISSSPENLDFNVIKVRQMTATRRALNGQTHVGYLNKK